MMIRKKVLYAAIVIGVILCLATIVAIAGGNVSNTTNNYSSSGGGTGGSGETDRGISNAMCLGMTQFDYDRGWQVSGGGGWWQDESSGCVAFGSLVDEFLITGGGACDTGVEDCSGAITFSTHF
jgi:hypothetical protein